MNSWGGQRPGAGRPKGSKNQRTEAVEEMLERVDCNPILGLAYVANNDKEALGIEDDVPIALRAKAYADLAQYIAPKRLATELLQVDARQQSLQIGLPATEQGAALARKLSAGNTEFLLEDDSESIRE